MKLKNRRLLPTPEQQLELCLFTEEVIRSSSYSPQKKIELLSEQAALKSYFQLRIDHERFDRRQGTLLD